MTSYFGSWHSENLQGKLSAICFWKQKREVVCLFVRVAEGGHKGNQSVNQFKI